IICAIETGSEPFSFQWAKNGNPIIEHNLNNIKITKSPLGSRLNFKNIGIENEGNYTCVARNEFGSDSIYTSI
ncbi:Down syndrome cell adhesion molecule-like protein 1-like protein, partial [Leptotrombidium deliense]